VSQFLIFINSFQVAEMLGRLIIEELNLPPEKRTIPPEVGIGEAGGVKYIAVSQKYFWGKKIYSG
jgi:hypothetical protein